MAELYPTKTRLALLRAVQRGEVTRKRTWTRTMPDYDWWIPSDGAARVVTSRMDQLRRAGWVKHGWPLHASMYAPIPWMLTGAGEQILAEHPEVSDG